MKEAQKIQIQTLTQGKCRVCGCSNLNPCFLGGGNGAPIETCSWLDADHTLCSNLECIAVTPLRVLMEMRAA